MLRQWIKSSATALALLGIAGCAANSGDDRTGGNLSEPDVLALDTYEAELGTLVEIYGEGFAPPERGESYLVFDGMFDADDGGSHRVDNAEFKVRWEDSGTLQWDSFGPYRVPFGASGNQSGLFHGNLSVRTVLEDGTVLEDNEPLPVEFRVKPSLLLHEFQPITATCAGPIKRALGGVPYKAKVEAVGFEPESFTYSLAIASDNMDAEPIRVRHAASGKFDTLGEAAGFRFPEVPENMQYYTAQITVAATGQDGQVRRSNFAVGVHRPIEIFYNGNVRVAEFMAPEPVSGCIPGGKITREVSYRETTEETRTRSTAVSFQESFSSRHTIATEDSATVQTSVTNGVGIGVTEGQTVTWEVGGNPGKIHLGKLGAVGLDIDISRAEANSREVEETQNVEEGLTQSETTTNSESLAEEESVSEEETLERTISSSEAIGTDFTGTVLPDQYGVFYRQTLRLVRRGLIVTYNQCGAPNVVGDYDVVDWTWAPDMAQGGACPPLPDSNLPPAECVIEPCSGE